MIFHGPVCFTAMAEQGQTRFPVVVVYSKTGAGKPYWPLSMTMVDHGQNCLI